MINQLFVGVTIIAFAVIPWTSALTCYQCELGAECANSYEQIESDCNICLKYSTKSDDKKSKDRDKCKCAFTGMDFIVDTVEASRQCVSVLYAGYTLNTCTEIERGDYKITYCACDDVDNCNGCSLMFPSLPCMVLFSLIACFFKAIY